ncbi:MAG: hypothetical protein EBS10_00640 [Acidimicrobiia bacterium]|nr:hypothetical protein [Acidimicrobiia bacterium]
MSITDRQRLKLLRTLETVIGPEDAGTLMDHLPPVTWANVATVDHVSSVGHQTATALRGEMQVLSTQLRSEMNELGTELRGEMNQLGIELRSEVDQHGSRLEAAIERGFRRRILALGTLGTAWFAIATTILQLAK